MATPKKPEKPRTEIKVKDLKTRKDPKGGDLVGRPTTGKGE
jgi:hypothetical protein